MSLVLTSNVPRSLILAKLLGSIAFKDFWWTKMADKCQLEHFFKNEQQYL